MNPKAITTIQCVNDGVRRRVFDMFLFIVLVDWNLNLILNEKKITVGF